MKSVLKRIVAGTFALTLGLFSVIQPTQSAPALADDVSAAGQAAFGDLTACLTSSKEKSLDVFYLIDNSNSLNETDPKGVRFQVLENSIAQLGDFAESGVTVRFAAAIFATNAAPLIDWTEISDGDSAKSQGKRTADRLKGLGTTGKTDWEEGVRYAYDRLSESDSCRAMIWFTDGAINPDDTEVSKFRSLDALCHANVSDGKLEADEYGLLAKFKKENISVFAVLLEDPGFDAEDRYFVSYLKALVEGSGELAPFSGTKEGPSSGQLNCANLDANGLALPGQSNGALLRAEDPVALAYQFLKLETQIDGGSQGNMVDGKFTIGAGTVGFRIVALAGEWTLTGPADSEFVADSANAEELGVEVAESSGLMTIDVRITELEQLGEWKFDSPSAIADVYVFSGLTLELDRDKESMVISGRDNSLTGKVVREPDYRDVPIDLSVYQSKDLKLEIIHEGELISADGIKIDVSDDGQFRIEGFRPPADLGSPISVRLTLEVGAPFTPIRAEFILNVIDASVFPTATQDVIKLSKLSGPNGVATGTFEVAGAASGEGGRFCFAAEPMRTDDPATVGPEKIDRIAGFAWKFEGAGSEEVSGETCFNVPAGEKLVITVSVTNPTQANSKVISVREVRSTANAADAVFSENLTFEFETETERNDLVTFLAIALLLLLGFLLPLTILYIFNRLISRFDWDANVVRADFDVVLDNSVPMIQLVDQLGNPLGPVQVSADTFQGTTPAGKTASASLGQYGELKARTPFNPLRSSWFEWVAPAGKRVISIPDASYANPKPFAAGKRAEVNSGMTQNWAFVADESELGGAISGPIRGTLIVFAKRGLVGDYAARVSKITNNRAILDKARTLAQSLPKVKAETPAWPGVLPTDGAGGTLPPPPPPSMPPPPGM